MLLLRRGGGRLRSRPLLIGRGGFEAEDSLHSIGQSAFEPEDQVLRQPMDCAALDEDQQRLERLRTAQGRLQGALLPDMG